mgnify:FL=1
MAIARVNTLVVVIDDVADQKGFKLFEGQDGFGSNGALMRLSTGGGVTGELGEDVLVEGAKGAFDDAALAGAVPMTQDDAELVGDMFEVMGGEVATTVGVEVLGNALTFPVVVQVIAGRIGFRRSPPPFYSQHVWTLMVIYRGTTTISWSFIVTLDNRKNCT